MLRGRRESAGMRYGVPRCGFRHTDLFNAVCTALRCYDIMAGKRKRLGHCLCGLTATSHWERRV